MTSNPDMSDPWDWDVDRVVQELCTPNRIWKPPSPAMLMVSDPISLEAVLREQEVNGSVILGEVNMNVLKDDFGIKALGRRSFIMSAVDQFRTRSLKYQSRSIEQSSSPVATELGRSLQEAIGRFQWANVTYPPSQPIKRKEYSFTERNIMERSPETQAPRNIPLLTSERQNSCGTAVWSIEDRSEAKQKTPLSTSSTDGLSMKGKEYFQENILLLDPAPDSTLQPRSIFPSEPSGSSKLEDSTGKKRKRLEPTLISHSIQSRLSRDNPTLRDPAKEIATENKNLVSEAQSHNSNFIPDPGVLYIGSDGLKRMAPLLLSSPNPRKMQPDNSIFAVSDPSTTNNSPQAIPSLNKKRRKLAWSSEFIGRKKMTIDSIFYGGVPAGSEIPNTDNQFEFYVGHKNFARGRRLYVHNALKYFFRSQRQDITDRGKVQSVIFPYSSKLVPRSRIQSFTVFLRDSYGKIIARRESKIDELAQISQSTVGEYSATFNPLNHNILESLGSNHEWNYTSLEKYKYLEGANEILPLYGESDEENEFDEATWKEIEAELGTQSRPEQRLKKSPITEAEIMQAISAGITDLVNKWKSKNDSKREIKAWRLWVQSRRLRNKKEQILAAEQDLIHVQEFLEKMQNRILKDIWTSQSQVRKQMGSLEVTVFNREELKWKISVLKQKKIPDRPPKIVSRSKVKKSSSLAIVDDDGESISASEMESSDDDRLDDFIVDDHNTSSENEELHELDLLGSEKDDVSQSDSSSSDDLIPQKSTKAQIDKKSQYKSSHKLPVNSVIDKKSLSSPKSDIKAHKAIDLCKSSIFQGNYTPSLAKRQNICSPKSLHSRDKFVDLTLSSSEEDNTPKKPNEPAIASKVAQQLNQKLDDKHKVAPSSGNSRLKPGCIPSRASQAHNEYVNVPKSLSSHNDPNAIAKHSYGILRKLADRERLLIKYFYNLEPGLRLEFKKYFGNLHEEELWSELLKVIGKAVAKLLDLSKIEDEKIKQLTQILNLFEMFIDCEYHSLESCPDEQHLKKLLQAAPEHFHSFYQICSSMIEKTKVDLQSSQPGGHGPPEKIILDSDIDDIDESPRSATKRRRPKSVSNSEGESGFERRPHGKRKKLVHENKEARDMREENLRRLAQQDERRKKLHAALNKINDSKSIVRSQLIINDAAAEGQKLIYVNDHIAKRIKKHQVEGVRFMWNQIVTIADEQSMQGCLLAHTMGLGKTMQT